MTRTKISTGRLIVFEGPDGVGKSTLVREVSRALTEAGTEVVALSFPGAEAGSLGKLVYDVHHAPTSFGVEGLTPAGRQALHLAAHLDIIERRIEPLLRQGKTVVLDRFWWSMVVYGAVGGVEPGLLSALAEAEAVAWHGRVPDLTVLLRREAPIDRDDSPAYWLRLRAEYDRMGREQALCSRVLTVNNDGGLATALSKIMHALAESSSLEGKRRPATKADQLQLEFTAPASVPSGPRSFPPPDIAPLKPSPVYDTYWRFAAERQEIFFRRFEGASPPWTSDPILSVHKFTNAYRASDRVSQFLIRNVIYRDDLPRSLGEVFFRVMIFKIFNKIETWQMLEKALRTITLEDYSFDRYDKVLSRAMADGRAIYSAAYIMPSAGSLGHDKKHRNHLALVEKMIGDSVPQKLADAPSMQRGFELLRSYPTIGDFLAYQYITDVNYSEISNFTEMEFVVPGPGALDGLKKCFLDLGGLNEAEAIRFVADRQELEFERLGLRFRSLWGRRLQLIDCQNLFCEVDKYARVHHPEIAGLSGRTRIKQKFAPNAARLELWYPPKWSLNDRIPRAKGEPR